MQATKAFPPAVDAAERPVRFTRFAVRRTGLVESKVSVKIGPYYLVCAPFQLSRRRGVFVAVLSPEEAGFFSRFEKKLCRVSLAFQPPGSVRANALFLRGTLRKLGRLKDARGLCLLDVSLLSCPSDLDQALRTCLHAVDSLERLYGYFAGQVIDLNEITVPMMGFDGRAEIFAGTDPCEARITSLAVDRLVLEPAGHWDSFQVGARCLVRPRLQSGAFDVDARVISRRWRAGDGLQLVLSTEFTPELVEIVDGFFFRRSFPGMRTTA